MEKRPYFIEFLDVIPFEFMRVVNLKLLHSTEMIQFVIGDGFFWVKLVRMRPKNSPELKMVIE